MGSIVSNRRLFFQLITYLVVFFIIAATLQIYAEGDEKNQKVSKPNANDNYKSMSVNQIKMWFSNNGDGSHDPATDGCGFFWPGGPLAVKSAIFEDGLVFGGMFKGQLHVNGNTHRQGLQAGKILPGGTPDDPSLEKYRVYKILNGWESLLPGPEKDAYEKDYNEWPIMDGAPYVDVNGDGQPTPGIDLPKHVGDETAWFVSNDMDPQRTYYTYGTLPMGLEIQTTVFAFNRQWSQDMIFKKYLIINKSDSAINDMYLSYWADPDMGDSEDDFSGFNYKQSLAYTWNSDNIDGNGSGFTYGNNPPAVGYNLIQGPKVPGNPEDSAMFMGSWRKGYKNLYVSSFVILINSSSYPWKDPEMGTSKGAGEFYNYMQGLMKDGTPIIDPLTSVSVKYMLSGDPVTSGGWYEGKGWPGGPPGGDRRQLMTSGPFTFAPSDTQEIVIGIFMARGSDYRNSITLLKEKNTNINEYFNVVTPPFFDVASSAGNVSHSAGIFNVYIDAYKEWTATSDTAWLYFLPTGGNSGQSVLTVNYDDNPDFVERIGTIKFSCAEFEKEIRIVQTALPKIFNLNYSGNTVSHEAGTFPISVVSNLNWHVSSASNWLTVVPDSGYGNVNVSVNYTSQSSTSARTGIIVFTGEGINKTVYVFQNGISGVEQLELASGIPEDYILYNNYPNPFNPSTKIFFGNPELSQSSLKVYDIMGNEVAVLLENTPLPAGNYTYTLDASNLSSGVYIYVLTSKSMNSERSFIDIKKMTLLK